MTIRATVGDITLLRDTESIVNAANGIGVMGAGVAGAIVRAGGKKFSEQVRDIGKFEGPFSPGQVYVSESGYMARLGIKSVYHAVTMKYPGTTSTIQDIVNATKNVCDKAIENGVNSIAFPGLGTGIGGLNKKQVAQRMCTALHPYSDKINITVIDIDEDFINFFQEALDARITNQAKEIKAI